MPVLIFITFDTYSVDIYPWLSKKFLCINYKTAAKVESPYLLWTFTQSNDTTGHQYTPVYYIYNYRHTYALGQKQIQNVGFEYFE